MSDRVVSKRRTRNRISPAVAGTIVIVLIAILAFIAFSPSLPFSSPYEVKAVIANAANIQPRSPVRIAGVNVGEVKDVQRHDDSTTSEITMTIQPTGLPIYKDAEMKVRPRIFLEGNFFVDIQPGTPGAGKVPDGGTIPITQTASPVQLDQVLTSLQADTRKQLQVLVQGYGNSLNGKPLPGEDADQDPSVKGLTAGQALNKSLNYSTGALRGLALVNEASLGSSPDMHDLSRLIAGFQKVSGALSANDQNLKDLVTNFNRTMAAFASESGNLRSTIHLLPGVLEAANPTLADLNAAFPPTRAFAREILPGVRQSAATIDASFPWITQTRALVSPAELQGLVRDLRPATASTASVVDQSLVLLPQVDLVNRCVIRNILPTGNKVIDDGFLSSGLPNYKEFWQTMTSLSGESQNFDGNGSYTRFQTGGSNQTVSTGPTTLGGPPLFGNAAVAPIGTRPARPASKPPYNRTVPCYKSDLPNLTAKTGGGP
jgi:phospholipid/cholesterol/gamma-HCH transport system substrate-binding protein